MKQENRLFSDPPLWGRRKWLVLVAGVFIVQLTLIWVLGDRNEPPAKPEGGGFAYVLSEDTIRPASDLPPLWRDPSLFVRAHKNGFSKGVWDSRHPVARPGNIWTELTYTLDVPNDRLTMDFVEYTKTNHWVARHLFNRPEMEIGDLTVPDAPFLNQTVISVEGEAASRKLRVRPELPLIESAEYIPPVTVEIALQTDGTVSSGRILFSSGVEKADKSALQISHSLVFDPVLEPQDETLVDWAQVVFLFGIKPLESATPIQEGNP